MTECQRQRKAKRKSKRHLDTWNNRTRFGDHLNKSRQTIWRWERAGLLPKPDGYDPFGHPLWRDSTIENFIAADPAAA